MTPEEISEPFRTVTTMLKTLEPNECVKAIINGPDDIRAFVIMVGVVLLLQEMDTTPKTDLELKLELMCRQIEKRTQQAKAKAKAKEAEASPA